MGVVNATHEVLTGAVNSSSLRSRGLEHHRGDQRVVMLNSVSALRIDIVEEFEEPAAAATIVPIA